MLGRLAEYRVNVGGIVSAEQLFPGCGPGIILAQCHVQATGYQPVIDCRQARRLFRVVGSHIVQLALVVGDVTDAHA